MITPARWGGTPVPIEGRRSDAATAELTALADRTVVAFRISDGKHVGAIGPPEGAAVERAVHLLSLIHI